MEQCSLSYTDEASQQQLVDIECGWVCQVEDEWETESIWALVHILLIYQCQVFFKSITSS